jgi:hypothetical protein
MGNEHLKRILVEKGRRHGLSDEELLAAIHEGLVEVTFNFEA